MHPWKYQPAGDHGLTYRERNRSLKRENGAIRHLVQRTSWGAFHQYLNTFHHLRIAGRENLPARGPFVLVANHGSHLDTLTLGAALPPSRRGEILPLAAGDFFFRTPVLAAFSAIFLNALPVWRRGCRRKQLQTLRNRLESQDHENPTAEVYILFPEGTRSRDGRMHAFKSGVGYLVAGSRIPVVPCRLTGAFEAWPPRDKWPHQSPVSLEIGSVVSFEDRPRDRAGWRSVAEDLEHRVRSLRPHVAKEHQPEPALPSIPTRSY